MNICIAHAGDLSRPNGATDRLSAFTEGLRDAGHQVYVVSTSPSGDLPREIQSAQVYTVSSTKTGLTDQPVRGAKVAYKAKKISEQKDAFLQIEFATLAGISSLLGNRGYLLDMLDLTYPSPQYDSFMLSKTMKQLIYRLEKRGVRDAEHILTVSSPLYDVMRDWGRSERSLSMVPNGFSKESLKPYLNTEEVQGRVGFIGSIHAKLDFEKFVQIAEQECVESVQVIGKGPYWSDLKNLVERRGANVNLTGYLNDDEAYSLLSSCQVVIYPLHQSKHTEMLSSRKIFDYAGLGKAMVIDDVSDGNIWQNFKNSSAGVFVSSPDSDEFISSICNLIDDDQSREELGRNALQLADEYTWDKRVAELCSFYDDLESSRI